MVIEANVVGDFNALRRELPIAQSLPPSRLPPSARDATGLAS
jgi:hypothetical protein